MASILRPSLLRHTFNAAPAKRLLSTRVSPIAASTFKTSTPLSRQPYQSAFVRNAFPASTRIAAFHATGSKAILPPLPQRIEGTLNDAAKVPDPTPLHGSYHWTLERIIASSLIPLTVLPFATGHLSTGLEAAFLGLVLIHSHIGFESIIIDYVPQHRLPGVRRLLMIGLKVATAVVAIGLYEFETNDVGLTETVKRIWKA